MANEITTVASLAASKSGASVTSGTITKQNDMTGGDMTQKTVIVGQASAEAIDFDDITGAPAMVLVKNLDATNYVEIGLATGPLSQKFIKLLAGQVAVFPPSTATMYWQANTADVTVLLVAVEL